MLSAPVPFPLEAAGPSVRLRVVRDLWDSPPPEPLVQAVLAQPQVQSLARSLRRDGTWASWLHRAESSTENAVTRLAELGCPLAHGPFARAVPPLLALLRGERSPFLDLRRPSVLALSRTRLRRVAAGLLGHAGLGALPEVRDAVEIEVQRTHAWVARACGDGLPLDEQESGSGRREWVYRDQALDPDGLPVPDLYWLRAVAFASGLKGDRRVAEVLRFVLGSPYQHLAQAELGILAREGQRVRPGFGIRCLEPAVAAREGKMGEALVVAELLARAGMVQPARHMIHFLQRRRDQHGRVSLTGAPFRRGGGYAIRQGWIRLSSPWRAPARAVDLTFRLLLLQQLSEASTFVRERRREPRQFSPPPRSFAARATSP